MTAKLAIGAPSGARDGTATDWDRRGQRRSCARPWRGASAARRVEAVGTFAVMSAFAVALIVMAGEWLGDATVAGMAEAMASTARVAMMHVAEASVIPIVPGT